MLEIPALSTPSCNSSSLPKSSGSWFCFIPQTLHPTSKIIKPKTFMDKCGHQIMDQWGHTIMDLFNHPIMDHWGHTIMNQFNHSIMNQFNHPIMDQWGHQIKKLPFQSFKNFSTQCSGEKLKITQVNKNPGSSKN